MENSNKSTPPSFELRSEKVRNVVGKIPPIWIRYGISIIALSLLILLVISSYFPYTTHFTGEISILGTSMKEQQDNVTFISYIKFHGKRPSINEVKNATLVLYNTKDENKLIFLDSLSIERDIQKRQFAICYTKKETYNLIQNKTHDFQINHARGSILQQLFSW